MKSGRNSATNLCKRAFAALLATVMTLSQGFGSFSCHDDAEFAGRYTAFVDLVAAALTEETVHNDYKRDGHLDVYASEDLLLLSTSIKPLVLQPQFIETISLAANDRLIASASDRFAIWSDEPYPRSVVLTQKISTIIFTI